MSSSTQNTDISAGPQAPTRQGRNVLVVANHTATSPALINELKLRSACGTVRFHLVVPALATHLQHWLSDSDSAVRVARERGREARSVMAAHGIRVRVEIGDSVPMHAIADALVGFDADEILICTLPASHSHWLERDLIERARQGFDRPVTHLVSETGTALAA